MLRVPSPAKLNLFLHIVGRRENGYHNLQSIFQLIDLCDYLTFIPNQSMDIQLYGLEQVNQNDNLIYRACQLLRPHAQHFTGLDIHIEKHIPMGAGLGGGSSNSGTTLLIVNHLWQCRLNLEQLAEYAQQLGADVPFFVYGKNAWVEGIGEHITPIQIEQKKYILLKPDCFISTQQLFSEKTLTRDSKITKFSDYQIQPELFSNNFQPIVRKLYPEVHQALSYLEQFGQAKLTGTGSCVFLQCTPQHDIDAILHSAPCQAYFVNGLSQSPVFDSLIEIS